MEHPNAALYRQVMTGFRSGDLDSVKGLLAPDVRWHEAGNPEPIEGREAVLQRLGLAGDLEGDLDIHDLLANDEHVVALMRADLRKRGAGQVAYPVVEVVHVKDGMVTERWAFMDAVPGDVDAFFADL
jgi:ketosteroid isomerase-like protein